MDFLHPADMPLWHRISRCEPSCRLCFFARRQRGFARIDRQLFALLFVCFAQCSPCLLYFLPAACYTAGKLTGFLAGRRCSLVRFAETTFTPQGDASNRHLSPVRGDLETTFTPQGDASAPQLRSRTALSSTGKRRPAFLLLCLLGLWRCASFRTVYSHCIFNFPAFSALSLP